MKKFILLMLLILPIVGNINAQSDGLPNEYFELVRTYNTLDEVYQAHPELKPEPPKIIITDEEVLFYGDGREVVNTMPIVKVEDLPKSDSLYGKFRNSLKIYREYRNIGSRLLLIEVFYRNENTTNPMVNYSELYNSQGELITNLLADIDVQILNEDYFVSTYEGEVGFGIIEVFNYSGDKICTYRNDSELEVRIDNYDNVVINRLYDFFITIVDMQCQDVMEYNYFYGLGINTISDAFYSKMANESLISTYGYKAYLIDAKRGSLIWQRPFSQIEICEWIEDYGMILVQIKDTEVLGQGHQKQLVLLNSQNGESIYNIIIEDVLLLENSKLICMKGGIYYEYKY